MDLIRTWYDDRYFCTLHFDTSLIYLDVESRSHESETSAQVISHSFQSSWREFAELLRLVCV